MSMQAIFPKYSASHGFTIVELIVVVTVLGLLGGLLFGPLDDLYVSNVSSSAQTTQDSDTRGALRQIANDLAYTTNFLSSIPTPASPTGSDNALGAWNSGASVLMASMYATDKPASDSTRKPVSISPACDPTLQQYIKNTYIYFVKSNTLYRRVMVNTPTMGTPCTGIAQNQSCASGCPSTDAILLRNVTSFTITYYVTTDPSSPVATGAGIDTARTAKIALKTQPASTTSHVTPSTADIRISVSQ